MANESGHDILDQDRITREHRVMKFMVLLSFVFLILVAAILPQTVSAGEELESIFIQICRYGILVLWILFVVEFVIQGLVFKSFATKKRGAVAFGAVLLPPLRIAIRPGATPDHLWIPFLGWRRPNKALRRDLEEYFSAPMMLVALMILPMLALEFIWTEQLMARPHLSTAVNIGTRVIWLAFAVEFLVMVSVSKKRIAYCKIHWVDLAIILLPLVSFLRALRLLRLGRLAKLQKMSRIYRLRGLAFRALRALLILRVLDRASHRFAQKRLDHLIAKVDMKKEEIEELLLEIEETQGHISQMKTDRAARSAAKAAKDSAKQAAKEAAKVQD